MRLGFAYDDIFLEHGHDSMPEAPRRLRAIRAHLEATGWLEELTPASFEPAQPEEVAWVHDPEYVEEVALLCRTGGGRLDFDTEATPRTYEAALAAVGACMTAARKVLTGHLDVAFCAIRPPGHHALPARGMGFCFFNNAALAAEAALRQGAERVAILDWDAHHGNGTQEIFYHRGDVLYMSIHQAYRLGGGGLFYPGTGTVDEIGVDAGLGKTINVPLPAGAGDEEYAQAFEQVFVPAIEIHAPDIIIVSAGYDAHHADPIAEMNLSTQAFHRLTRIVTQVAETTCDGAVVFVLEGGYNTEALACSVEQTLRALAGQPPSGDRDEPPPVLPVHQAAVRRYLDHAIEMHKSRLGL